MIRVHSESESGDSDREDDEEVSSEEDDIDKVIQGLCDGGGRPPPSPVEVDSHTQMLELYALVARCIAFPFTAQARTSMSRTRHLKLSETNLSQYCEQFESFLKGNMSNITSDEAFDKAILCYYDNFLLSKRLLTLVRSGGCTFADLRKVFQNYVEKFLKDLPLMERVAHDHVLAIWMSKYEAICRDNEDMETFRRDSIQQMRERQGVDDSVAPDHLYKVFQSILSIPQREHHLLSKELQLDNADEQATVIRMELRHRHAHLNSRNMRDVSKLLVNPDIAIAQDYQSEQLSHITKLRNALNQMPISKKADPKRPRPNSSNAKAEDGLDPSTISKADISISTSVSLTVRQGRGIEFLQPDRSVFCVMEMDGHSNRMATAQYPASKPVWDTFATFPTNTPLPVVRIKLLAESNRLLDTDGKVIGKLTLQPSLCLNDGDHWYKMVPTLDKAHNIEVQASVSMEKADNVKFSGWLYCVGRDPWKKWKRHYFVLVQMTTYAFVLCTFREKHTTPAEVITLTGCTVDYCEDEQKKGTAEEGYTDYQFQLLVSDSSLVFCSTSRSQMEQWVYHLARATGQAQKPQAPQSGPGKATTLQRALVKSSNVLRELNLDENALSRDITSYDHARLYALLLKKTLEYRLKDPASSMGWLTPGQQFALDEYQARYCLRGFTTHLAMIRELMEHVAVGTYIDASLMQFSFTFCLTHIQGQKPDNYSSVTKAESADFADLLTSLHDLLRQQLESLTHSFPFCLPDGGLKSSLRLFSRVVSARDGQHDALSTNQEKVTEEVCDSLRKAALQCYSDVADDVELRMAEILQVDKEEVGTNTLEFLVNLSEECIDQMGQSQVDYSKAFSDHKGAIEAFEEAFWSFYEVDLEGIVQSASVENGKIFRIFEQLNTYLLSHEFLRDREFHGHLLSVFMPLVADYVDIMAVTLEKELMRSVAAETWRRDPTCAKCAEELFVKLRGLHRFVQRLAWPEALFAEHLDKRVQRAASDLLQSLCNRAQSCFSQLLSKQEPHREALYIAPAQCWVMIDVVIESIEQASLLCVNSEDPEQDRQPAATSSVGYGGNTLESLHGLQRDMMTAMAELLNFTVKEILVKLSHHDPANPLVSLFNKIRSTTVDLDGLSFSLEHNLKELQEHTSPSFASDMLMTWYSALLSLMNAWLEERPKQSLRPVQTNTLQDALEVVVRRFIVYFSTEQDARTSLLTAVEERLRLEQSAEELRGSI